ncbi:MAG: hypothetical protein M3Z02_00755, partial [Actinomycetota bacterium]|nr:hypothetical protein [Actinomycetota bacterium]
MLVATGVLFLALNSFRLDVGSEPAAGLAFPIVGALIMSRRPGNRVGWLVSGIGVLLGAELAAAQYAAWGTAAARVPPPGVVWAAWATEWLWIPPMGVVLTLLLLVFPTGRLPSRRWVPVGWSALLGIGCLSAAAALQPGPLGDFQGLRNPLNPSGPEPDPALPLLVTPALTVTLALTTVGLWSLVRRFHRARGTERAQVKWFAFGGLATIVEIAGATALDLRGGL